jgi:alpha-N-arabinofuranosidase
MRYYNPILSGFHPDPSICCVHQDYYLVTSSFEYFPGLPIFHSRDLLRWEPVGHVLTRPSQLPLEKARSSGGCFAPTIRHHNGRYYVINTNVTGGGNFYVSAERPDGEWSEPTWVDMPGIDPDLFFDEDGTVYLTGTGPGRGIYQTTIDIETGKRLSEIRMIWSGTGGKFPEGPHLYKINGLYYLLIAEGGTEYGHMITVARGPSPSGPFESCPHNPILSHRSLEEPIQGTGHSDLFQAPDGRWWIVFLGFRPVGYPACYHLGRETFLMPAWWDEGGWPHVGFPGKPARATLEVDVPDEFGLPDLPVEEPQPIRDDFSTESLGLSWNFLRNPHDEDWSLEERFGWLRLNGTPVGLDDADSPAFVGRRQEHFFCRAATWMEFEPEHQGDEAGLTVLMNNQHHYEIAVTSDPEEGRMVIVRRRIGNLWAVTARETISAGPVKLEISADRHHYNFGYAQGNSETSWLAEGETRYLSTEVAGGFTGVYLGLYCHSPLHDVHADFDWFDYEPLPDQPEPRLF